MEDTARQPYALGLTTLDAETEVHSLPVEGQIPPWLSGMLLRTGPAKFEAGERRFRHWFDGQAMLHRFSFADGAVSYANRYLRTEAYAAAARGRIDFREFATDPCRSIFKRAMSIFRPGLSDNANVNLARLGDEYIAMTETPLPVAFDPATLETLGVAPRPPGHHATAHPHYDPERRELIAYVTQFGPRPEYRIYAQAEGGRQRTIATLPAREPSYMHSFALTERYAVLIAFPLLANPLRLALANRPFIENYRWKPEAGTRILVFERSGGRLRGSYEAEARFAFHHVNAFERDSELVIDLCAYDDASIIDALYLDRLRAEPPGGAALPRLLRYRVGLDSGSVAEEELADVHLELPRIDYGPLNGRPYRYVYGAGFEAGGGAFDFISALHKLDVESGESWSWSEPGSYPGEPVFAPVDRAGRGEDEGVLLSVVLDVPGSSSYLLVLDARDLGEIGRARVPHHIPFGFHGDYFS